MYNNDLSNKAATTSVVSSITRSGTTFTAKNSSGTQHLDIEIDPKKLNYRKVDLDINNSKKIQQGVNDSKIAYVPEKKDVQKEIKSTKVNNVLIKSSSDNKVAYIPKSNELFNRTYHNTVAEEEKDKISSIV